MSGGKTRPTLRTLWPRRVRQWLRYIRSRIQHAPDADDLLQQAAVSVLRADPEFRSEREANAYMMTAIKSALAMRARAFAAQNRFRERFSAEFEDDHDQRTPLERLIEIEKKEQTEQLVQRTLEEIQNLPEEEREALELALLRDRKTTLAEIAERQEVAVSTVYYRVQRALKKLKEALDGENEE